MTDRPERPKVLGREPARPLPRRFYKTATAGAAAPFAILLDGRPAKTPKQRPLAVAARPLASAIAAEWDAQATVIDPATMPLTRLVTTAIDAVAGRETDVAAEIVDYAGSDLVCYRAAAPAGLVERQSAAWDPVLTFARAKLGAEFTVATGLVHAAQPAAASAAVAAALEGADALRIAALHTLTTLTGSALIALAHAEGAMTFEQAWGAAHVDEDWQIAQWGADAEAAVRRQARRAEAAAASFALARHDGAGR